MICSSDFARARQTARAVRGSLGAAGVISAPALRERYFGDFDGGPVAGYAQVWAADEASGRRARRRPGRRRPGRRARAAVTRGQRRRARAAVLARAAGFVAELERRYSGRDILLVSHGDTLQILQAGFAGLDPARHRTVPHLEVAEIRPLHLAPRPVTPP